LLYDRCRKAQACDPLRFAPAFVDHGAVAWSGDLDLVPDAMYSQIKTGQDYVLTGEPGDVLA
jgi:hypothetical protein